MAAAPPPRTRSMAASRMMNSAIIDAYGSDRNDMETGAYYNDKQFQNLPPMPQAPAGQGYDDTTYGAYNAAGAGGLPIAQVGSDGRYVAPR